MKQVSPSSTLTYTLFPYTTLFRSTDTRRGQTDRDADDAEAGDQAGDVDPHIVEDDDRGDREQRDADQQADDAHRIAEGFIMSLGGAALDQTQQIGRAHV